MEGGREGGRDIIIVKVVLLTYSYLGPGQFIQPLDDLVALDEAMHSIHIHYQLPESLQDILLVGLVTELAHLSRHI